MNARRGFTLAEMAVAVVILALLLFGAMVPFSAQVDIRSVADTRRTMDSIKEAIVGFALANGRLPCAADGSIAAGAPGAGIERVSGNSCTAAFTFGVIPWVTLGVPETDAWGRRFSYRVSPVFADTTAANTWSTTSPPGTQSPACAPNPLPSAPTSFALCSLGDIAVFTRTTGAVPAAPLGSALPAVFISHGRNGLGAWQSNGTRLPAPAAGTDEAANVNGNTQATPAGPLGYLSWAFYSRDPTPASAGCADPAPPPATSGAPLCEFDDTVVMISSSVLIARMVAAGRLP
jgi:prepilin-type N-terminal cleavage/methylation domain-containing protein